MTCARTPRLCTLQHLGGPTRPYLPSTFLHPAFQRCWTQLWSQLSRAESHELGKTPTHSHHLDQALAWAMIGRSQLCDTQPATCAGRPTEEPMWPTTWLLGNFSEPCSQLTIDPSQTGWVRRTRYSWLFSRAHHRYRARKVDALQEPTIDWCFPEQQTCACFAWTRRLMLSESKSAPRFLPQQFWSPKTIPFRYQFSYFLTELFDESFFAHSDLGSASQARSSDTPMEWCRM